MEKISSLAHTIKAFDEVMAKISNFKKIGNPDKDLKMDYFHDWVCMMSFNMETIYNKLINTQKKELIFALTTNNHPPYTIPKQYRPNKLQIPDRLKKHVVADLDLIQKRFQSYSYALDSLGKFLTKVISTGYQSRCLRLRED